MKKCEYDHGFFFLSFQEYNIEDLKVYTQYLVSLRVFNPEGNGPETIVVVMTDEGGRSAKGSRPLRAATSYSFMAPKQTLFFRNGLISTKCFEDFVNSTTIATFPCGWETFSRSFE